MAEFTILDAPETPAPVFAFRALKGVIFGSPNDYDEHKENAGPSKQVPTLRSKISALRAPSLSPSKRRKTNQYASPAKSILRMPGIPTPRKQNIAVSFKDVTPSLSPELTRRHPMPKEKQLPKIVEDTKIAMLFNANQAQPTLPQVAYAAAFQPEKSNSTPAVQSAQIPEQANFGFDFEAYRLSTEKEMKKLIRFGQKMREYARKQDEENTKLRIALEELQKENEGLRQRKRSHDLVHVGSVDNHQITKPGRLVITAEAGRRSVTIAEVAKISQRTVGELDFKGATQSAAGRSPVMSKSDPKKQGQSSPLKRKASMQLNPKPPISNKTENHCQPDPQAINGASHGSTAAISGSASARLPQERIAAARERIRLKTERRKATGATTSSPVNWNAL